MASPPLRETGIGLVVSGLVGLIVALATSALLGFSAAVGLGVVLVLVDVWWRRRTPERVLLQLDDAARYVIQMRTKLEAKAQAEAAFYLGRFELPVFGKGFIGESMYGRLSVAEARQVFFELEQLGVIEKRESSGNRIEYCWTSLGEKVKATL